MGIACASWAVTIKSDPRRCRQGSHLDSESGWQWHALSGTAAVKDKGRAIVGWGLKETSSLCVGHCSNGASTTGQQVTEYQWLAQCQ